jgi:hypothetical protein
MYLSFMVIAFVLFLAESSFGAGRAVDDLDNAKREVASPSMSSSIVPVGAPVRHGLPEGEKRGLGMSATPTKDEPAYITRQRRLIDGKKFTIDSVALFSGTDIFSDGIRLATGSPWSHVGLVLADQMGGLYCFESTGSPDEIVHEGMFPQVQIDSWDHVVKRYSGVVATRKFIVERDTWNKEKSEDLTGFVKRELGVPYEKNMGSLLKAITGTNNDTSASTNSLFCSELTALTLMRVGHLPQPTERGGRFADNYLPSHFGQSRSLPLISARLEEEQIIKGKLGRDCCSLPLLPPPPCVIL